MLRDSIDIYTSWQSTVLNTTRISPSQLGRLQHEAHVWFIVPESVRDSNDLKRFRSILSDDELAQHRRFHFPEDAHRYLVSHMLVRQALSKYMDIAPSEWVFARSGRGRPEIANPDIPALRFNLTHTTGLSACIVTLSQECGVDSEQISARRNPLGIAERMFSRTEFETLQQLGGQEYLEYFFVHWTLREAYVKAKGIGISFPTRKLTFTVEDGDSIDVSFHPDIADKSENWKFQLLRPTKQHITAIAISRDGKIEKNVITRFLVP